MKTPAFPILTKAAAEYQCEIPDVWVEFDVSRPTARQGLTKIRLHPGRADEMAVEFFCFGGCYLLAAALHERSGWPLVAYRRWEDGADVWVHMGVETPAGDFLDIAGVRTQTDLRLECGPGYVTRVTLEAATAVDAIPAEGWTSRVTGETTREVIRFFADQLVTQAIKADPFPQGGTTA